MDFITTLKKATELLDTAFKQVLYTDELEDIKVAKGILEVLIQAREDEIINGPIQEENSEAR